MKQRAQRQMAFRALIMRLSDFLPTSSWGHLLGGFLQISGENTLLLRAEPIEHMGTVSRLLYIVLNASRGMGFQAWGSISRGVPSFAIMPWSTRKSWQKILGGVIMAFKKNTNASDAKMRFNVVAILAIVWMCSMMAAIEVEGSDTTEFYDEDVAQSNTVDFTAVGSTLDDERFGARVRMAFHDNLGGVINCSVLGAYFDYGVDQTKTLKLRATSGTNFGIGSPSNPTPISGTGAFASSSSGGYDFTAFEFTELQDAEPGEQVVEFGVTALSTRDYGNVEVTGQLAGGGTMSATRHINNGNAAGDTFYGFTAPEGKYFTSFSLSYDGPIVSDVRLWFDDIGFRTAQVGQQRLEHVPAIPAGP